MWSPFLQLHTLFNFQPVSHQVYKNSFTWWALWRAFNATLFLLQGGVSRTSTGDKFSWTPTVPSYQYNPNRQVHPADVAYPWWGPVCSPNGFSMKSIQQWKTWCGQASRSSCWIHFYLGQKSCSTPQLVKVLFLLCSCSNELEPSSELSPHKESGATFFLVNVSYWHLAMPVAARHARASSFSVSACTSPESHSPFFSPLPLLLMETLTHSQQESG